MFADLASLVGSWLRTSTTPVACFKNSKSLLETYVDNMYILFFVSQGIGLCNSTTAYVREINKKRVLSISNKCESCDVSMRYQ